MRCVSRRALLAAASLTVSLGTAGALAQDPRPDEGKDSKKSDTPEDDELFKERDEAAVERRLAREPGLLWLARHQSEDGRWSALGFGESCQPRCCCDVGGKDEGEPERDTAVTSVALLAFSGSGYTALGKGVVVDPITSTTVCYGKTIERGLDWLLKQQGEDGRLGPDEGPLMVNHATAALALGEAFGLTNAKTLKEPVERAVHFIEEARTPGLGWGERPRSGKDDTVATTWCVMALQSARFAGLDVAAGGFEGAHSWLDLVTDETGCTRYDSLGSPDRVAPGKNDAWGAHPAMTARALLCRMFARKRTELMGKQANLLVADLPRFDVKGKHPSVDYDYWYLGDIALSQWDGPEGDAWRTFDRALRKALVSNRRTEKDGCLAGSWDAGGVDRWAHEGGRVYATALNVLVLSYFDRHPRVFKWPRKKPAPEGSGGK